MNFRTTEMMSGPLFSDEDSFEQAAALDEVDLRVRSRAFRGGNLTAVMSGVILDLREAALSPEGATISVQSAFTDIDILIPGDWDVVCDIGSVFGGVQGERVPPPTSSRGPSLRLTGMVVVGEVCVR